MRRSRLRLAALLILALSTLASAAEAPATEAPAAEEPAAESDAEARLLELIEELATLLDTLPPEQREAARRLLDERLAEAGRAEADRVADVEAPSTSKPPAEPPATQPAPTVAEPETTEAASDATSEATTQRTAALIRPPSPTTIRTTPPPAPPEPATEPTPSAETTTPTVEPPTAPPARPALRCELAVPLDTDDDRLLTAFDRYWRHLYLWTDVDGDGDLDEREAESPYERGIRSVELGLGSFVRGKGKRKRTLDITIEERVIFDVGGDGYGGPLPRRDDGALVIDASAIRADGGPDLRDADGEPLDGLQALRPGQRWILADGRELIPRCR